MPEGKMKGKTKINIYRKVFEGICRKHEGAGEFIQNKIEFKKNCVQSMEYCQKRSVYMFVMLRTQFGYVHSLW